MRARLREEAQHEANATGQRVTLFWCGLEGRYRYVIGRPMRVGAVDRETIWPEEGRRE